MRKPQYFSALSTGLKVYLMLWVRECAQPKERASAPTHRQPKVLLVSCVGVWSSRAGCPV